jgi:hypothetical protein
VLVRIHGGWLSIRSVGFGKFQPITLASQPQVFSRLSLTWCHSTLPLSTLWENMKTTI